MRRGAILPFGGHKGFALALAMHALGVSAEYLFIAFKPDLFAPVDDYRRALASEIPLARNADLVDAVLPRRRRGDRPHGRAGSGGVLAGGRRCRVACS